MEDRSCAFKIYVPFKCTLHSPAVLCADIERPFRLSLSRPLLRDLSQLITDTSDAYHRHLGSRGDSGERRPEGGSERRPEGHPEGCSKRADKPSSVDWKKAALHTQLKLSSCQVSSQPLSMSHPLSIKSRSLIPRLYCPAFFHT